MEAYTRAGRIPGFDVYVGENTKELIAVKVVDEELAITVTVFPKL